MYAEPGSVTGMRGNSLPVEVNRKIHEGWEIYAGMIGLEGQVAINMQAADKGEREIDEVIAELRRERLANLATFYEMTGRKL